MKRWALPDRPVDRRGSTLIELLAAVALLGVVTACVAAVVGHLLGVWGAATASSFDHTAGRLALDFLARDLRCATEVLVPGDAAPVSQNLLKLRQDAVEVEYVLRDGELVRRSGGSERVVVTGLQGFSVERRGAGSYEVCVGAGDEARPYRLASSVTLRNPAR